MTWIDARPEAGSEGAREWWAKVDALDLEPVVYKLMHPDAGEDALSLDQADDDVEINGLPRQFSMTGRTCPTLFHLLLPGAKWQALLDAPFSYL